MFKIPQPNMDIYMHLPSFTIIYNHLPSFTIIYHHLPTPGFHPRSVTNPITNPEMDINHIREV